MGLEVAIPRATAPAARRRWRVPLLPLILPIALLIAWQLSITLGLVEAYQLTPPLQVLQSAVDMWNRGLLQNDILATIFRVVVGFGIGAGLAVLLGTITGLSRRSHEAVEPTLQAVRSIPTLAWAPLLLLWLGIGEAPKVTLVAIGAFFPVYVNLVAGIRGVDRKLVEVGRIYNLTNRQIAWRVILPASLPSLFTGLRLGLLAGVAVRGGCRDLRRDGRSRLPRHRLAAADAGRPDAGRDARPRDPRQGHRHDPRGDRAPGARRGATPSRRAGCEPAARARRHPQELRRRPRWSAGSRSKSTPARSSLSSGRRAAARARCCG